MDGEVEVTVRGFKNKTKGHIVKWESNGDYEDGGHTFQSKDGTHVWHDTYILRPGNFLFVDWHPHDDEHRSFLIKVPVGDEFEKFVEAAAEARKKHWSDDHWILEFNVAVWDVDIKDHFELSPSDLAEAVEMYVQKSS